LENREKKEIGMDAPPSCRLGWLERRDTEFVELRVLVAPDASITNRGCASWKLGAWMAAPKGRSHPCDKKSHSHPTTLSMAGLTKVLDSLLLTSSVVSCFQRLDRGTSPPCCDHRSHLPLAASWLALGMLHTRDVKANRSRKVQATPLPPSLGRHQIHP